jgi:hypothetical protein
MIHPTPSIIRTMGSHGISIVNMCRSFINHNIPVTNSITGNIGKTGFLELFSFSIKAPCIFIMAQLLIRVSRRRRRSYLKEIIK